LQSFTSETPNTNWNVAIFGKPTRTFGSSHPQTGGLQRIDFHGFFGLQNVSFAASICRLPNYPTSRVKKKFSYSHFCDHVALF
jgi:hypothetical protein